MKNLLIIASLIGILFSSNRPYVVVLGIAQDGGLPHAGCDKTCCKGLWETNGGEKVSCIGVVDPRTKKLADRRHTGSSRTITHTYS